MPEDKDFNPGNSSCREVVLWIGDKSLGSVCLFKNFFFFFFVVAGVNHFSLLGLDPYLSCD